MSQATLKYADREINKGLNLLGLSISQIELNALCSGKLISLEHRDLSEIGSLFLLASALAANKLERSRKKISFGDLFTTTTQSGGERGIPIYCWRDSNLGNTCLYLTLVDGKPGIRTGDRLSHSE